MGAYTSQVLAQFTPPGHNVAVNFVAARQRFIDEQRQKARFLAAHGAKESARDLRRFADRVEDTTPQVQRRCSA